MAASKLLADFVFPRYDPPRRKVEVHDLLRIGDAVEVGHPQAQCRCGAGELGLVVERADGRGVGVHDVAEVADELARACVVEAAGGA